MNAKRVMEAVVSLLSRSDRIARSETERWIGVGDHESDATPCVCRTPPNSGSSTDLDYLFAKLAWERERGRIGSRAPDTRVSTALGAKRKDLGVISIATADVVRKWRRRLGDRTTRVCHASRL